ncbi:MAG: 3-dehydroquinate synthase [Sphingopyxis sp.]|nr:3-dehydroquinate synthase [Sphingopyxis sp.]
MPTVTVALGARSYDVVIASGVVKETGARIAPLLKRPWVPVVTDATVAALHLPALQTSLDAANIAHDILVLDAGEATKSWAGLAQLTEWLVARGIERSDHVIALGGGVIGDLVGFAASIVKRGCGFIQIPTTLLAQVDSSVGGKTAINIAAGKNMVGAFHQPALVLADPAVLATLPRRDLAAGYAEVVKYGLIDDAAFFAWCEDHGAALLAGDTAAREQAIAYSVAAKARIVAADERETHDVRALLNLGHTFGHALEAATGYSEKLLHGEAVAAGMALAYAFSTDVGLCPPGDAARVAAHLQNVGLPQDLASAQVTDNGTALAAHMAHDKKARGGMVPLILARGIGQSFVSSDYGLERVAAFLDRQR